MLSQSEQQFSKDLYEFFNRRDMKKALAHLRPDVQVGKRFALKDGRIERFDIIEEGND